MLFVGVIQKKKLHNNLFTAPLAPEQGTGPDTAHRSFRLRLPDRRTAPVSTAISPTALSKTKKET